MGGQGAIENNREGGATGTLIVAPMPEELAVLRARLDQARPVSGGRALQMVAGRLADRLVILAVTGDGERNARQGLTAALATLGSLAAAPLGASPVQRLIGIGVAGALSVDLPPQALVIAERVIREFGEEALQSDPSLVDPAIVSSGGRRGVVMTTDRIVDTVVEKRRLLAVASAGLHPLPVVVDLESASYAGVAARAGIPWLILRAVSDTAQEGLPALLNRCRDEGGAVRRGRVALELLGEPGTLPVLLALRQRVRDCAGILARATEAIVLGSRANRSPAPTSRPVVGTAGKEVGKEVR